MKSDPTFQQQEHIGIISRLFVKLKEVTIARISVVNVDDATSDSHTIPVRHHGRYIQAIESDF
jgi:hypothetical protein